MANNKKAGRIRMYAYLLLTLAGCVLACSSLITNEYLKLGIVMGAICVGVYGIMRGLSGNRDTEEIPTDE